MGEDGTMFELSSESELLIAQQKELAEFFGIESRNKYELTGSGGWRAYAAEQGKGFLQGVLRQLLGHWRTFEIQMFNAERHPILKAIHPFRWFLQRLEVFTTANNRLLGAIQQRFAFFSKRFDVEDAQGNVILSVRSPLWRAWTFVFVDPQGKERARIEKKWSGLLKEALTDADNFRVAFTDPSLDQATRNIVVAAGLFIDLQYFEQRAGN